MYNKFVDVVISNITAEMADGVNLHGEADACHFLPVVLVSVSKNPVYLEQLRCLKHASYAEGPLP